MREGELEQPEVRSLRQSFLKFLKQLLSTHPLAERQLIDEVDSLAHSPTTKWNLSNQIEAYLLLYTLCPSERERICYTLLNLLKETKLLQTTIQFKNVEEIQSLLESAQTSLGGASICLRHLLTKAVSTSPVDPSSAMQMIEQILGKDRPFYFPHQLKKSLEDFRRRFESSFQERFPMIALKRIDPDEVRAFQRSCYEDFYENVLQKMLAFPLWMLNHKKIKAELHVYGSTAREELVPFSDLEVIFLLEESDESDRVEQNGLFLGSIIEWIGIQITALGESQTFPEELAPLIDGMPPKGLSLDSTPNLAVLPLRAMNTSLPICMTTLSTLCKFQQEGRLIQEEKEKLLETDRSIR